MTSILDRSLGDAFEPLNNVRKELPPGSREQKALDLAVIAALYVYSRGRFKGFRKWLDAGALVSPGEMASLLDFDCGELLEALGRARKHVQAGSEEEKSLDLAVQVVRYVCHPERSKDFRRWHEEDPEKFDATHVFATREEATAWRDSGKATEGERVLIAGDGYEVVDVPGIGLRFGRVPLPGQLKALALDEDETDPHG